MLATKRSSRHSGSARAHAGEGSLQQPLPVKGDLQPSIVHSCSQVDLPPITEEEKGEVEDPDRDDESDSPKEHTPEAMGAAAVARRPSMALPPVPQRAKPPSGGRILPVGCALGPGSSASFHVRGCL